MTVTVDEIRPETISEPAAVRRLRSLMAIAPLLLAVGLLMAGTGLSSSLLGLRAGLEGFDTTTVGLIMAGYYAGFLIGSLVTPRLIRQVGHIRVFSGLASLASVGVLVHVVVIESSAWWGLRMLTGFCVSGLFVVTETWLNGGATNANRGRIIALYMVVVTGSQAIGQLLLNLADPAGFGGFVLTSVLVSLAVVPVALSDVRAPEPAEATPFTLRALYDAAPLAVVGAAVAGFTGAVVIGVGAVYASNSGLSVGRTSLLLFATLAAAVALQFPIGRVSDRTDRRRVVAGVAIAASLFAAAASQLGGPDRFVVLLPFAALAGGLSFSLYSLANAHLNDYLPGGALVAAGALMVLVNGAGAVAGPIVASAVMDLTSPDSFFVVLSVTYLVTGIYALYRIRKRAAVPPEERAVFVPLPTGATPSVAALSPGAAEELYPIVTDSFEHNGVRLHWYERGGGEPVMLVHDAGSSAAAWSDVSLTLADVAYMPTAFDLRGHGRSARARSYTFGDHVDDLLAVMTHRRIVSCPIVGHGHGAVVAAAFAAAHPERVSALVLVSADHLFSTERDRSPLALPRPITRPLGRVIEGGTAHALQSRIGAKLGAAATYGRRRDPRNYRRLATDLRLADPTAVAALRRAARRRAAGGDLLAEVVAPVLQVRGKRSSGTAGDEVELEGAGYYVQLDEPEALTDVIDSFLRSVKASSATPLD